MALLLLLSHRGSSLSALTGDGRRPEGVTVFPYSQGKCLCWDATCDDSLSATSVIESAIESSSSAHSIKQRKCKQYSEWYIFEPLAVIQIGVIGPSSRKFLAELSRRIAATTGECHKHQWLVQRISLTIARGKAAAILATLSNL